MKYICKYHSPVDVLTLASDGTSLTGLWMDSQKYFPKINDIAAEKHDLPIFDQTIEWLDYYFQGKNPNFTPPTDADGSEFRKSVWNELLKIPYGSITTYGEIAHRMSVSQNGKFISPRAVGNAVGHNPISIIVPCHRVIGSNGSLTGYAGGLERKVKLLNLEGVKIG
ncbi:MAG: methylated-DNA--[protein]-cysteine S-methyltransferase [Paludibacteraceae bacterium]